MTTPTDQWNPGQYERFRTERMQPFFDLTAMIRPQPGMRAVDLGCGTGELTALLADQLPDARVQGIDSSPSMLAQAAPRAHDRLAFHQQDIATIDDYSGYDLVFSHAALQWVPDNETLLRRILTSLRPGAQVAIQVPRNEGHASHRHSDATARRSPFREQLNGFIRVSHVLTLERYAELLWEHGFREQVCIEKIYGHVLARSVDVVEWVKGTSLAAYLSRLTPEQVEHFLQTYTRAVLDEIGEHEPYFYPFRRMLFWGIKS